METNNTYNSPESLENVFFPFEEDIVKKNKNQKENTDWDDQPGDLVSFI